MLGNGAPDPLCDRMSFDPATFFAALDGYGHVSTLGLSYRSHGPDWCELTLPWRDDLVGDELRGTIASGAVLTLLDMTSGMAIWTRLGRFAAVATLDLRLDYLRAAAPGAAIIAKVECYRLSRDVCFVRGLAHDGDPADPVAHCAGSFMFLKRNAA